MKKFKIYWKDGKTEIVIGEGEEVDQIYIKAMRDVKYPWRGGMVND
jgi:hypothetical protein